MSFLIEVLDPVGIIYSAMQLSAASMAVWNGKRGFWYWAAMWAVMTLYFVAKEAIMNELDRRDKERINGFR